MRRDWDLVREILLRLESAEPDCSVRPETFESWDDRTVSLHIQAMGEAGLVDAQCQPRDGRVRCSALRLTWAGHELAESVRAQSRWDDARRLIRESGMGLTVETLKLAVHRLASQVLGGG